MRQLALNETDYSVLFQDESPADNSTLFKTNTRKQHVVDADLEQREGSVDNLGRKRDENGSYYICARSTKRNPDLLIPGGALKGNMYFKQRVDQSKAENNDKTNDLSLEASDSDVEDDAFSKLKN